MSRAGAAFGFAPCASTHSASVDVAFLHRGFEQKARAGSVRAHVEHRPVRILPCRSACASVFVDELEPPEDVAAEMRVVQDLDVERLGAALEQQLEQRRRIRLPRRVLFAFTGHAGEDGVACVAGHVEVVRIRAMVEQQPRDRQRVLDRRRVRKPRVGEIQDRRPVAGAAAVARGFRTRGQDACDFFAIAAHDRRVNAVARDRWILARGSRCAARSCIRWSALPCT